jgi:long-chain acyl-CoA synthetase
VYATQDANQPIAIIFPHEVNLRHAIEDSQINKDSSLDELCHNEHVKTMVLKDLNSIGKKNGFRSNELLQAVILTPDEWTTQSGLLTAAQKIQRGPIAKAFAKEIEVCQYILPISLLSVIYVLSFRICQAAYNAQGK